MAKKKPPTAHPTSGTAALKHNPFAALAARAEDSTRTAPGQPAAPTEPAGPTQPVAPTQPQTPARLAPEQVAGPARGKSRGRVVLRRETKHRGGKAVIVISGLGALPGFDLRAASELAQQLKQQLGCGGTVEERGPEREIILQGDRAAKVAELLRARGFRVDGVTS
jgi:translation initiation factor 1 (eIF-1/SUI1)